MLRVAAAVGAGALTAGVLTAVAILAPPEPASAQTPTPLAVTYVARVCDSYSDIMANKARNNIQESLFNLGPNSTYAASDTVDPGAEAAGSPGCRPFPGWRFSTGSGITGKSPATANLSTVTGLFRSDIVTEAATPLLDGQGRPVQGPNGQPQTIEGAVTVQLSGDEATWVRGGRSLWVQGGSPTMPLNGEAQIGFGALRCAQDALNGDNVDAVTFPQGRTHVFCYYYAVTPPPPPGTITVVKAVTGAAQGGTFDFQGNVSYNPGGAFTIAAAPGQDGAQQFVRGATLGSTTQEPWSFTELAEPGWSSPPTASCISQTGQSVITTSGPTTSVDLAGGDAVTCTYTNTPEPLGAGQLAKQTVGGVGSFPFRITGPTATEDFTAVTTAPGEPVVFATRAGAPSGTYTATETMPTDFGLTGPGTWMMTSAVCNDTAVPVVHTPTTPVSATAQYTAAPGTDVACLFTNTFTPSGSIDIVKTSVGGTGRFEYSVLSPDDNLAAVASPAAVTTAPGEPTTASPSITGISAAPGSRYLIRETMPAPDGGGFWVLDSVDCGPNALQVDLRRAGVLIALTPSNPHATCRFENRYQPYGTLSVTKTTTPDEALRPGAATIDVVCTDGVGGSFSVAPGQGGNDSGIAAFDRNIDCAVTEPETGAADGVAVITEAVVTVDDGPPQSYTLGDTFAAELGRDTQVVITNRLAAPSATPTPTSSPPPGPQPQAPDGDGSRPTGALPVTGGGAPVGAFVAGLGMLVAGTAAWLATRRRREDRASDPSMR
jgi:LPXTG-motif cell wall-anchored protein